MAAKSKKMPKECLCYSCGFVYGLDSFYKTPSKSNAFGVSHMCKECVNELFMKKLKKFGSLEATTYFMCALLDVPFIKVVYEAYELKLKDIKTKNPSYFGIYLGVMNSLKKNVDKWDDFSCSDTELGKVKAVKTHEMKLEEELQELRLVWGNKTVEQLHFLEYRFTDWTDTIELGVSQEKLYRDLCLLELRQRELNESNEETKNVQAQIMTIMKVLKIDQFEQKKEVSLIEQMLESHIKEVEEKEPCEIFDPTKREEMDDFLRIKEGWEDVKRCLKNLLLGHKDYNIK